MSDGDNISIKPTESILSDELLYLCLSESLSVEGLHEIIERHQSNRLVRDYDFFLVACCNVRVTEGIIRCLLEYFPAAIRVNTDDYGCPSLLHVACGDMKNVTPGIVQLLIDAAPDSVRSEDLSGLMPLHYLCMNINLDETAGSAILKLLIKKCPEAVRHETTCDDDQTRSLPIHIACESKKSPDFCRLLIDAYPGSERIAAQQLSEGFPDPNQILDVEGALPLHYACRNNTVATVQYLYKLYPDAINHATTNGHYPIHAAIRRMSYSDNATDAVDIVRFLLDCDSKMASLEVEVSGKPLLIWACCEKYSDSNLNAALQVINLLYDACPESARKGDRNGMMPLHYHCLRQKDETTAIEILRLLLEKDPEAVCSADKGSLGNLPIHIAGGLNSLEYCRVLIEAYPGSERMTNLRSALPFHFACGTNAVATVEYLYKLYPDAINHAAEEGHYPIHYAISGMDHRNNTTAAVGIVKFLLDCDPNVKFQKLNGTSLLQFACHWGLRQGYNDSTIQAGIQMIKVIYDAHPEEIEHRRISSDIQCYHQQVRAFINSQLVYSRQAKDHRLMTTPDDNGQLPLHRALQNNVRLGSIKLLVKGNPSAVLSPDISGALPLHIACQHHDSANSVMQHLVTLDATTLEAVDRDGNTALHLACRGARHEIIAMLLEKYDNVSVSKRNADKKLPIDLLWESNEVLDRESIEYTESVFRLLRAYPEMMMNCNVNLKREHQTTSDDCSSQNGKKRKSEAA